MSTDAAFNPKTVLILLLVGAAAFIATLWMLGTGRGADPNNGNAHAASKGLTGFAALADILRKDGYEVSLSRREPSDVDEHLLILTPPPFADPDELKEIIEDRRYSGPTILVLPKWQTIPANPASGGVTSRKGWVALFGAAPPVWFGEIFGNTDLNPRMAAIPRAQPHWRGLNNWGALPDPAKVMAIEGATFIPLVTDNTSRTLVGYWQDNGFYPVLAEAAGVDPGDETNRDASKWNVTVVFEPDLFNNYGMADSNRTNIAREIVYRAMEGENLPIAFDLTLHGLGGSRNLLTLAFEPPFLAATLCLILAMLVVGWRAMVLFGAPQSEGRAIEYGKRQLVENSAAFIERTGRTRLLAEPYARLTSQRIAQAMGTKQTDEQALDALIERRAPLTGSLSERAEALRSADTKYQTLRAAQSLRELERTLTE